MGFDRRAVRKVYVRAPNWLGDVVMATPAFARVRSFFAEAEIVGGVKQAHAKVLAGSKSFDRLLFIEKPRGLRGTFAQAAMLRREGFDAAVLFPNSVSSALVATLARIKIRIGYSHGRRLLITDGMRFRAESKPLWRRHGPRRRPVPMVDYWFALLDHIGMPKVGPHPILRVTPFEERAAAGVFDHYRIGGADRLVLLSPTASFGSSKYWDNARWADVARAVVAADPDHTRILVLCGPGEEDVAADIAARTALPAVTATLPPIPLDVMKPVVRRAALMLTTDSGPRHLAVAFDVPHVVLMGPTHPDYTSRNADHAAIVRHDVECGPCHLPVCPTDHRCMDLITAKEVIEASLRLLG